MAKVQLVKPAGLSAGPRLDVLRFVINESSSGNNPIVDAPGAGLRIVLLHYHMTAAGAVDAKWRSANTDLSGAEKVPDSGSGLADANSDIGLLECAENEALNLHLSDAVAVTGYGSYCLEPVG